MKIAIPTDKKGKITAPVSLYRPSKEIKDRTAEVTRDYERGLDVQTRTRPEFNDRSLLDEIDENQRAFNSYVPPRSEDPDESWRAQTVRPVTRNKVISIAAHATATVLYPASFAQDSSDEEDRGAAEVMQDLKEYVINNSNYPRAFISAVISSLVDPASITQQCYRTVYRTVKDIKDNGLWDTKNVLDEHLSGFFTEVIPLKQILFPSWNEPDIQRQRFIIRNRFVDYQEADLSFRDKEAWKYVKPGVRTIFDEATDSFYDVEDDELQGYLVNEVTYYHRTFDLELTFLNGILLSDSNQPIRRKDKLYPMAKLVHEPIGNGQCFVGKSAVNKLSSDQGLIDTLYNMIIDGAFLALMPPMAAYGTEDVNSSVIIPGMITSFRDPNVKLESIGPRSDLRAGLETIGLVEKSLAESSQDSDRAGVSGEGGRTAREVLLLEKNAQIALGLFGKSIRFFVEDLGKLMDGDILQYLTVGEAMEATDGLKFHSFLLPEKVVDGKKVTKKIKFVHPSDMEGMTESKAMEQSYKLMEEGGGPDGKQLIYQVNPEVFRERKFKTVVRADEMGYKSKALEKALSLEAWDRMTGNPLFDQEAIARDFLLEQYRPGETDKYIAKQQPAQTMSGMPSATPEIKPNKNTNTSMLSAITGSNNLGIAASTE